MQFLDFFKGGLDIGQVLAPALASGARPNRGVSQQALQQVEVLEKKIIRVYAAS
ncbi:hypothetical protein D3C71_2178370 [compost metagenome]